MRKILLLCAVCLILTTSVSAQDFNMISNPSFTGSISGWAHNGNGEAVYQKDGGVKNSGCLRLSGGIAGTFIDIDYIEHSNIENTVPCDRFYNISAIAKGNGKVRLGVRTFVMTGKLASEFVDTWSEPIDLSADWKKISFTGQEKNPGAVFLDKVMIEYQGSDAALIDDVMFSYVEKNDLKISFEPTHAIAQPGDKINVKIHTDKPKTPLHVCLYPGHTRIGRAFTDETKVTDENGDIFYSITVPAACREGMRLAVSDPSSGTKKSFFVNLLAPASIQKLKESASKITAPKKVLFFGDSLTKYDKGRNYTDIISGLLPAGSYVRNAGVGGDTTERVWLRLNGKKTTHSEVYNNLFEVKPDTVFIFLGANDSKAPSATDYKSPLISNDEQYKLMKQIISFVKEKTGARIIIISALSTYFPYGKENCAQKAAVGQSHNLFGIDKYITAFNETSMKIVREDGLEYIDVYTPTLNHPDKRQLSVFDDGVHLSLQGHELIATEVLKYLGDSEKK